MQISTNSIQYLNYQALARSLASGVAGGQNMPDDGADPSTAPPQSGTAAAATAAASTPASQFSSQLLFQLIQAQAGRDRTMASGANDASAGARSQDQVEGQGVHRGHHGHQRHAAGAVQAEPDGGQAEAPQGPSPPALSILA